MTHSSATGCTGKQSPQPAVSVGAGAIWMHVYDAVTTKAGRYVQGGGCATVGVAGLIQSGGFGSFSKNYGMAAAGLLEAEVVTADGVVRIANACTIQSCSGASRAVAAAASASSPGLRSERARCRTFSAAHSRRSRRSPTSRIAG